MLDISSKLKELREKHNYTIQAVSTGAGIAVRTYQNYEYGQREISADALYKLADFYGVTTDYLLGRSTEESEPIERLADDFRLTALEKKILKNYLNLPGRIRGDLMEFLKKAVTEVIDKN